MDFPRFQHLANQFTLLPTMILIGGIGALCALFIIGSVFYGVKWRQRSTREERARLFGSTAKNAKSMQACIPIETTKMHIQPFNSAASVDDSVFVIGNKAANNRSGKRELKKESSKGGLSDERPRWVSVSSDNVNKSSFESDENKPSALLWRLSMKLKYNSATEKLHVDLYRAKCSPAHHIEQATSSTYAVLILEPTNAKRQTQTNANNGAPSFDEQFIFDDISSDEYDVSVLRVSLYDVDHDTRNRIAIGHVRIALNEFPCDTENYIDRQLQSRATGFDNNENAPEIHVSLCYQPDKEKLKLHISAARNLPQTPSGTMHYLRIQIIIGSQTVKIKRSAPNRSLSSIFQCAYAFQVPIRHLDATCLQISVISADEPPNAHCTQLVYQNCRLYQWLETVLGTVTIGSIVYAHTQGVEHWRLMIQGMRKTHEQWHRLVSPGAPTDLSSGVRPKLSQIHQSRLQWSGIQIMSD